MASPTPATTLGIGSTQVSTVDGMVMVYVPAGEFTMGQETYEGDSRPIHTVILDAFWIDKTEVTNRMFSSFLNSVGNQSESGVAWFDDTDDDVLILQKDNFWQPKKDFENHPVIEVNWYGAKAYCNWVGKRLLTEAEWEKAAKMGRRPYPWGQGISCNRGNWDDEIVVDDYVIPGGVGCDGFERTSPVGSFPEGASPYGALDLAGNVWEWVADWYDSEYYADHPLENPKGPLLGDERVRRGGSWSSYIYHTSYRSQLEPVKTQYDLGFRCAKDAE